MTRKQIFNALFWMLLIIGIILVIWKIFGNSPTDLQIILTFMLMLLFKIWSISDELKEFKYEVKTSFHKVKEDLSKSN